MHSDRIQRLTLVNRKLVEDLNAVRAFLCELTHPEQLGHAVSAEVRERARRLLDPDDQGSESIFPPYPS